MKLYIYLLVFLFGIFSSISQTFAINKTEGFINLINPFWQIPQIDTSPFSFTIEIPIENTGPVSVIPTGRITLKDHNGNQLQKIALDGDRNELGQLISAPQLVDYLSINPEGKKVPAGQTLNFSIEWKGIGDQYLTGGAPVVEFKAPVQQAGNIPSFAPWEKLVVTRHTQSYIAHATIDSRDIGIGKKTSQSVDVPIEVPYIEIHAQINYPLIAIALLGCILFFVILIPGRRERIQENNQKAIKSLEKDTKKMLSKIHKKSSSGGSQSIKKKVKKIKNASQKSTKKDDQK